ncbi:MAG: helix-turn-helix domain-containing protein [Crocosphaera sp.]|nr:helix-turn-helix domain-containing protein [Crocosphaera sp.]
MVSIDKQFTQAEQEWDLKTLYTDLAFAKGKPLTPMEKLHLRALLCGHSPTEIAEKLGKQPKGVETDLCASVYRYVKGLLDKNNERLESWRKISEWLDDAGYKQELPSQVPLNELLPNKSVVNVTNISIENNQIVFQINLKIPTSQIDDSFDSSLEEKLDNL